MEGFEKIQNLKVDIRFKSALETTVFRPEDALRNAVFSAA